MSREEQNLRREIKDKIASVMVRPCVCGWCFPGLRSIDGQEVTTGACPRHAVLLVLNAVFTVAFEKAFVEAGL